MSKPFLFLICLLTISLYSCGVKSVSHEESTNVRYKVKGIWEGQKIKGTMRVWVDDQKMALNVTKMPVGVVLQGYKIKNKKGWLWLKGQKCLWLLQSKDMDQVLQALVLNQDVSTDLWQLSHQKNRLVLRHLSKKIELFLTPKTSAGKAFPRWVKPEMEWCPNNAL